MRGYWIGCTVAVSFLASGVEAAPEIKARRVELIAMGKASDRGEPSPGPSVPLEPAAPPTSGPAAPQDFRVHDLSRRWVEFQMADSFNAPADPGGGQAPTARGAGDDGAMIPAYAAVPPVSVPAWMTGGGFVSPPPRFNPGCAYMDYRPTGFLRLDAEGRRASYYGMMSAIACEYGIPVGLFDAMIIQESRYHPALFSPKNAFGLTQLMPGTAAALGVDRYRVEGNLRGGAKYLRQQLDRFGHYHLALAAYNAGPGRVRDGQVPRIRETQGYVENVLLNWSRLTGLQRRAAIVGPIAPPPPSAIPPARPAGRVAAVSTF